MKSPSLKWSPLFILAGFSFGWCGAGLLRGHAPVLLPVFSLHRDVSPLPVSALAAMPAQASLSLPSASAGSDLPTTSVAGSASPAVGAPGASDSALTTAKAEPAGLVARAPRHRVHKRAVAEVAGAIPDAPVVVVVRRSHHRLYVYRHGRLYHTFKVATGKLPGSTPAGSFRIIQKAHDPEWNYRGHSTPGGVPANPLGHWWMGLSVTHRRTGTRFGIHGTNAPWLIGRSVSHGCVRMRNGDAARLFAEVGAGTPVVIY